LNSVPGVDWSTPDTPHVDAPRADWRTPFLIALLVRLAYVLFYPQLSVHGDAAQYDALGWNLAQGLGYRIPGGEPNVYWAPGFPALLAGVYAIFGHSVAVIRIVQAILSALVVPLVAVMAARVFGRRTATTAALLCGFYPAFIGYSGLLLTETVFTLLLAVLVCWLLSLSRESSSTELLGLGALAGVMALCRAEMVLLPLFVFVALRVVFADRTATVKQVVLIYAAVVVTIAPWSMRNYAVTGEFIPLTIHGGDVLWISSYKEEWLELYPDREPYKSMMAGRSDVEASKVLRSAGIRNIVEDPLGYAWLCVKRFPRLWIGGHSNLFAGMEDSTRGYLERRQYGLFLVKLALLILNSLLIVLGAYGAYWAFAHHPGAIRSLIVLSAPVVFVTAIHFVLFSTPRFHVPVMPFMLIFAAVAMRRPRLSRS
jgi:4-amino-4-deoxy-L-arabinose transferase-like glycosyltransferase